MARPGNMWLMVRGAVHTAHGRSSPSMGLSKTFPSLAAFMSISAPQMLPRYESEPSMYLAHVGSSGRHKNVVPPPLM